MVKGKQTKAFTLKGERYAIYSYPNHRHYDLKKWQKFGDKKKEKRGKDGEYRFVGCYMNFPHLAKVLLNMAIGGIEMDNVQSIIDTYETAHVAVVQALESAYDV